MVSIDRLSRRLTALEQRRATRLVVFTRYVGGTLTYDDSPVTREDAERLAAAAELTVVVNTLCTRLST